MKKELERRLLWELKCWGLHDTQLEAETTLTGLPEPPTEKEKGSVHAIYCHYFFKIESNLIFLIKQVALI